MCTCYSDKDFRTSSHRKQFLPPICLPIRLNSHFSKMADISPQSGKGGFRSVLDNPPTTPWDEPEETRIHGDCPPEGQLTPGPHALQDFARRTWPFLKQNRPRWWLRSRKEAVKMETRNRRQKEDCIKRSCLENDSLTHSRAICVHDPCRAFVRLQNISLATNNHINQTSALDEYSKATVQGGCPRDHLPLTDTVDGCDEAKKMHSGRRRGRTREANIRRRRDELANRTKDNVVIKLPNMYIKTKKGDPFHLDEESQTDSFGQVGVTIRELIMTRPWQSLTKMDESRKVMSDIKLMWTAETDV